MLRKDGRITVATEVHHITPVESVASATQMKQLMFNYSNLMSVCHACHSDIHRKMFSHSKAAIKANNKRITESFVDKFLFAIPLIAFARFTGKGGVR